MSKESELKPCPFCGSEAIAIYCEEECCGAQLRMVECTNDKCLASKWCDNFEQWNKRV